MRSSPDLSAAPNFLHGRMEAPGVFRSESGLAIRCSEGSHARTVETLRALRPERLSLATAPVAGLDNCFPGTVEFASYLGGILEYYVRLTPSDRLMVQASNTLADPAHAIGDRIDLHWPAQARPRACRRWRRHELIERRHRKIGRLSVWKSMART